MREGVEIVDSGVSATSSAPTYRRDTNDLEADFANEIDVAMAELDYDDDVKERNAALPFTHVDSKRETGFADDVSSLQLTVDEPSVKEGQAYAGGDLSAIQEVDDYQYLRRRNWLIVIMLCIFLALTIAIGAGVGLAVKKSPNGAAEREDPSPTLASPQGGESGSGAPDSTQTLSGEEAEAILPFDDTVPTAAPASLWPTSSEPTGSAPSSSAPTLLVAAVTSAPTVKPSSGEPTGWPTDPVSIGAISLTLSVPSHGK